MRFLDFLCILELYKDARVVLFATVYLLLYDKSVTRSDTIILRFRA